MTLATYPVSKITPFQTWVDDPKFNPRFARLVLEYLHPVQDANRRWLLAQAASAQKSQRQFTLKHLDSLCRKDTISGVSYLGGRHIVFELEKHPGWVFKIFHTPSVPFAKEALAFGTKTLKDHPLKTCFVPEAHYFDLGNDCTLVQMEKATGIIGEAASREQSEKEFELFNERPDILIKWGQFFDDAARFICRNAYVDVGWHNMILDPEKGITFVDFEALNPSKEQIGEGLKRLLEIAPPVFFNKIIQLAKDYNCRSELLCRMPESDLYEDIIEKFTSKRELELALRTRVRRWHKEKGIVPESPIAISGDLTTKEKCIIDFFNARLATNCKTFQGSPVDQRCLSAQIFLFIPVFSSIEDVEATLERLKVKELLCTWDKQLNIDSPRLSDFSVYF